MAKTKTIKTNTAAELAGSSRTRLTALLNKNSIDISTDLMLRVLSALGYKAKLKVSKVA